MVHPSSGAAPRPELVIGHRVLGDYKPAYLIAEIGSNHDGSLARAKELVHAAAEAGADAVKFQSFTADGLSLPGQAAHAVLERLSLPLEWHGILHQEAGAVGVDFLSTPFDPERAALLASLDVPAFKIASGDITHLPLLRVVARFAKPIILSSGLASWVEVTDAVQTLRAEGNEAIAVLHCVSCYPAHIEEMNLRVIPALAERFGIVAGLSDHSPGHEAAIAALALGARIIEKHITFDRALAGPDHGYALTIVEFAQLVAAVRRIEQALGDGDKRPGPREAVGRVAGRRSIYAAVPIAAGTRICPEMLKIVRPGAGLAPAMADELVGRIAIRPIGANEPLTWQKIA